MEKYKSIFISLSFLVILGIFVYFIKMMGFGVTHQFTDSMKKGVFLYAPLPQKIKQNDVVLFNLSPKWLKFLLNKGYLKKSIPVMKKVFATQGDLVCIKRGKVYINQRFISKVLQFDHKNHRLPKIKICRILKNGEFFLMSTKIPNSFDSRYMGIIKREQIFASVINY